MILEEWMIPKPNKIEQKLDSIGFKYYPISNFNYESQIKSNNLIDLLDYHCLLSLRSRYPFSQYPSKRSNS